jgi:hypothetical protein
LRGHTRRQSRLFTEVEKLPERMAEGSQMLVVGLCYDGKFFAFDDVFSQGRCASTYRITI